jgi:hypothetical protein
MARPAVEVVGGRQLRRALRDASGDLQDLKNMHRRVADTVASEARYLVPVRSGLLSSTIRAAGQASGAVVRAGFARVPYAGPTHFGWPARNIAPQPFLYEARDKRIGDVIRIYEDGVAKIKRDNGLKD